MWHYEIHLEFKLEVWWIKTCFELAEYKSELVIPFDYLMEHFFLIFLKFVNQFSISQQRFHFDINHCFTK